MPYITRVGSTVQTQLVLLSSRKNAVVQTGTSYSHGTWTSVNSPLVGKPYANT